ncbi:short subunit dehydrogenase [Klebsiella oxytoca]|uniref:Short subunit dehydrogenase n=2 Tax=Klebsiella oxytoca TaxID=571 RepID=A0A318FP52_KLEOX|nr:short subunit dehydrogenase [Klebsiella oxytoca]
MFGHDQIAAWHLVEEIILPGSIASAFIVNITNKDEIAEAVNLVREKYGPIDSWINSSPIYKFYLLLKSKVYILNNSIAHNLKITFFGCQVAISHMIISGRGSIINISEQLKKEHQSLESNHYALKFGVQTITELLARELYSSDIRVNAILPDSAVTCHKKIFNRHGSIIDFKKSDGTFYDEQSAQFVMLKKQ